MAFGETKSKPCSGPDLASHDAGPCRGLLKLSSVWLMVCAPAALCSQTRYFTSAKTAALKIIALPGFRWNLIHELVQIGGCQKSHASGILLRDAPAKRSSDKLSAAPC